MTEAVVKDGRVFVRGPNGERGSVAEADAAAALRSGMRLETPQEFEATEIARERGTLGQQALTGLEAAAGITGGGATLGLAAPVAEALGGREYIEAAKERAEVNPTTRTVGDIGGAVGAALLSGGTGALGRAASFTPAALAARAGGAASRLLPAGEGILATAARFGAAGATEGAAHGLGGSLAKSVLEDTDWTADRALAGMRDGALYGLAGGAAIGGLGAAGGKVLKGMLGGRTLREAAEQYAEGRTVAAAIGDDARTIARLTDDGAQPGRLKEAAAWLRERGIPVGDHPASVAALKSARVADAQAVQAASKQLDAMGAALAQERRGAIAEKLADIAGTGRQGKAVARTITRELEKAKTFSDAADMLASVEKQAAKVADTPIETQLAAVRKQITEGLTEAAEATSPELASAYTSARGSHEIASALHEGAKAEAVRLATKASESPFSGMGGSLLGALAGVATGSISVGAITSVFGGMAQNAAKQMIRERGAGALMRIADQVALTTGRIEGAAKSLAGLKGAPAIAAASIGGGDFSQVANMLATTTQDPAALHAKIEKTIAPIARQQPEVAMAMARQITLDHAWLASKIPPSMGPKESLTPRVEPRPIPKQAKQKLVNYAKALADPVSVLEDMSGGRVNWDGIEALKERRPQLWDDMRNSVMFACAQAEETLPYRRKIMLSLAFEFQADESLGNVTAIQAASAQPPPPPPIPGAGQAPPPHIRGAAISSAADETSLPRGLGDAA